MNDFTFTSDQYESLGKLVAMNCVPGNVKRIEVTKELAGPAMMLRIEYGDGQALLIGIEQDGYCHT